MAEMTDDDLRKLVDQEFDDAMGGPSGEIGLERAELLQEYLSEPRGDEEEGSSAVVTSDVADVVDGIMPSLMRIFTIDDNLLSFDPVKEEDIKGAEQASDYINYLFFKRNPAFMLLYSWCWDGLAQKNGLVKCWWDESERCTYETYSNLTDGEMAELMEDDELEPIERDEREVKVSEILGLDMEEKALMDLMMSIQPDQETVTLHEIKFKRTTKKGRCKVENVPPDEFRISKDAKSWDISAARFCGHEREVTRSELLEMGFDEELIDSLKSEVETLSAEQIARKNKTDERGDDNNTDKSQDKLILREGYIKADKDGDGKSERLQVFTCNGKFLGQEPIDDQPFHAICPSPLPHKFFGRSVAEKVSDIQDINTTLVRNILMNLYHVNQPGQAVWEQGMGENTLDDLLTTRVGRIARFSRPVNESWAPMTIPFTAGSSFPMLELTDKMKRDRTGISSDSEGLSPEALKNIQQSVLGAVFDLSRMKIEMIARIFAETGIKSLFLHMHSLVLKHQDKAEVVRLRNEWVQVDPTDWRTRYDMTVNIGLGLGNREHNLIHLNNMFEKQTQLIQEGWGNLIVLPKQRYHVVSEMAKNAGFKLPQMFFGDPGDQTAPPPSEQQEQLQAQQQQLIAKQQQLDEQKQQLDMAKLQLQHQREMLELERKREKDKDDLMVAMENIRTDLTKIEASSGINVPGSRV